MDPLQELGNSVNSDKEPAEIRHKPQRYSGRVPNVLLEKAILTHC